MSVQVVLHHQIRLSVMNFLTVKAKINYELTNTCLFLRLKLC